MQNMLVFYARIITEIIYANYQCMIVKLTEVQLWARIIIHNQDQIIGDGQWYGIYLKSRSFAPVTILLFKIGFNERSYVIYFMFHHA